MEPIKFRDATEADLSKIVEIYNSTVASRMSTADTEPVSVESRKKWFYEHGHIRPLWIAENSDQNVVGWISFQSFYGRPAYNATVEISIYIDASYRGQGLGKKLLEHSIAAAPSLQIKTLVGFIFAHNEPSLRLFKNFGFEEWGNLPNIAILDNQERGLKILGKRVD
ncbi:GNAT family N-acetyltransferase [Mucilaginibacter kameinonensis]|uniref:GNAT family N-acetyltransferase n=1 Tax=Mucilaginibacter kameinonensis TaxID=452286 RepID=UPI001ABFDB95|nr:GNAT family N-acetyltransferase [Mucilaginibacter kameinonensis]